MFAPLSDLVLAKSPIELGWGCEMEDRKNDLLLKPMFFDFEVQVQCVCFLYRNFISLTSLGINWTSPWPQFSVSLGNRSS